MEYLDVQILYSEATISNQPVDHIGCHKCNWQPKTGQKQGRRSAVNALERAQCPLTSALLFFKFSLAVCVQSGGPFFVCSSADREYSNILADTLNPRAIETPKITQTMLHPCST